MILTPYLPHPDKPAGPLLPFNHRVYAVGDIHGRLDCLLDLQRKIIADQLQYPVAKALEIYLGDYTDRGPQSREVLDNLIARRLSNGAICLAGNHDLEFNQLLNDPFGPTSFQDIGGAATMRSYGVVDPTGLIPTQLMHAAFAMRVPKPHKDFLASISSMTWLQIGGIIFVHAGIRPNVPLREQTVADLVWIRNEFSDSDAWHSGLVIHGHTVVPDPLVAPNHINIDTGAYRSGRLTCIVFQTEGFRFLQGTCEAM